MTEADRSFWSSVLYWLSDAYLYQVLNTRKPNIHNYGAQYFLLHCLRNQRKSTTKQAQREDKRSTLEKYWAGTKGVVDSKNLSRFLTGFTDCSKEGFANEFEGSLLFLAESRLSVSSPFLDLRACFC